MLDDFLLVYLDDLLVFRSAVAKHELHLRWTFTKLREHKLYAKGKKCFFGHRKTKYLGHIVGNGKLSVDPDKVSAITSWPAPTEVKHLQ